MNFKTIRRTGIKEPPDGFNDLEEKIAKLLTTQTIQSLYGKLPTARMKFIVAAHFELGYSQSTVAEMLGVSQPSLVDEINLIRRVLLGKKYSPRRDAKVGAEHFLKLALYLNR